MSFDSLGLTAELARAISEQRYTTPTPIQARAIPAILKGDDILATAQTGTGKTAGFTLPLLQRLAQSPGDENGRARRKKRHVRVLVLAPTRELAGQVCKSIETYGKYLPFTATPIFGGVGMEPQVRKLQRGTDIVVATPGRLLDHMQRGTIDLTHVEALVLDEADRMLDMGFIHDIRKVLAELPRDRQNLMFSATFDAPIRKLAEGILKHPTRIDIAPEQRTAERVTHVGYRLERAAKTDALVSLIATNAWHQVLVFSATKHGADRIARKLDRAGLPAAAIHGNKSQNARTRALADFKKGSVQVLVATDIAARGIDIQGLEHVVNFELPHVPEDYVHRIGRTGRAGAAGHAVSLISHDENQRLRAIERMLKGRIAMRVLEDDLPAVSGERSGGEVPAPEARSSESPEPARRPKGSQRKSPAGTAGKARGPKREADSGPPRRRAQAKEPIRGKGRRGESLIGSVKFFNARKGFGYVALEGQHKERRKDVFLHASALELAGIARLDKGQRISFSLASDRDGRTSAAQVRLVD